MSNWQISVALSPTTLWAGTSIVFRVNDNVPARKKERKVRQLERWGSHVLFSNYAPWHWMKCGAKRSYWKERMLLILENYLYQYKLGHFDWIGGFWPFRLHLGCIWVAFGLDSGSILAEFGLHLIWIAAEHYLHFGFFVLVFEFLSLFFNCILKLFYLRAILSAFLCIIILYLSHSKTFPISCILMHVKLLKNSEWRKIVFKM